MSIMDETRENKSRLENNPRLTYLIPFVSSILSYYYFFWLDPPFTSVDSARYMLGALVQSEAAVVAIVITLSLVAVQLMASSYSPKTIGIFKKTPDFWILMGLYVLSICYGAAVLKRIDANPESAFTFDPEKGVKVLKMIEETSKASLEGHIRFSYLLAVSCFTALISYTYIMLVMLKPSTIIEKLSQEINKDSVLRKKDSIQPIIDIVQISLMKYDYETVEDGLRAVRKGIFNIIDEKELGPYEISGIFEKAFSYFSRVGKLAMIGENEDSVQKVIENIKEMSEMMVERGGEHSVVPSAIKWLGEIGEAATEKKLKKAAEAAIRSLGEIGKIAAEKKLEENPQSAVELLGEIGKIAAEKKLEEAAEAAVELLGEIGKIAAEKKLKIAVQSAIKSLGEIEKLAAEKKLRDVAYWATENLETIGKAAAEEEELGEAVQLAVQSLGEIGKVEVEGGLAREAEWTVDSLGKVGKAAAENRPGEAAKLAAELLEGIEKAAAKKRLWKVAEKAASRLQELRKVTESST